MKMLIEFTRIGKSLKPLLIALLLSLAGMTNALAQSFTVGNLNYSLNEGGITVTLTGHFNGANASGTLDIPSEVTYNGYTYTVTAIVDYAFENCRHLTGSLTIPNTVIEIGWGAFSGCSGFTGNLSISNSVTTIGGLAFYECSGFTGSLSIGNAVTSIGIFAFSGCNGFTSVYYNATNCVDVDVNYPPFSGFGGTLTIGNNVESLPNHIFDGAGFTGNLVIPNSMISIGENAFDGCSSFTGNLTIPNSVTTIGNRAFIHCTGFTGSLTIPNSVTSIGIFAFSGCSGFTDILTIGTAVTTIGVGAFGGCRNFTTVNFNATNCTTMGGNWNGSYESPFYDYESTGPDNAVLNIGENVQTIPQDAFRSCSGFTNNGLVIPNSVTTIGAEAFGWCSGLTGTLTIPSSVTTIGDYAFGSCNFTTLNFNATNCSSASFSGIPLTTLNIGNNVQIIPNNFVYGCVYLTGAVVIPESVTSIGNNAFDSCIRLTSLTIGNAVTSIGENAFYDCRALTDLTIGSSVNSIGNYAFCDCSNIAFILTLAETPPNVGYRAFYNVNHSIPLIVPCGTSSTYQNTSGWNEFTNIQGYCDPLTYSINDDGVSVTVTGHVNGTNATGPIIIPETKTIDGVTYTVTKIGNSAFTGCTGLTGSLTIPNSVTKIDHYAFSGCIGFTGTLTLSSAVTMIGWDAFFNCSGFTGTLTIPSSVTMIYDWAFGYCTGFSAMNCLSQIPPHTEEYIFNYMDYDIPVMVPCGSGSMYQYAWGWKNFTNIHEDCSGMFVVTAMANPVESGSVIFGTEGETLLADSFEEYSLGNGVAAEAVAAGHDWWTTWSGAPGSGEDGLVAEYNSTHCGHLTYGNDQILLLNKESGVYDLEFDILVPEGKNAFFSILHQFEGTADEAMRCHLHAVNDYYGIYSAPGHGSIRAGSYILSDIPCVYDAWMHIRLRIDIDGNLAYFYYTAPETEELLLCQWPWSGSNSSGNGNTNLAAMDFWPPMDNATSEYYIDNFSLIQFGGEASNRRGAVMASRYFAPGSTCVLTAIPEEGYTFANWKKDGVVVSTEPTYNFTVTEDAALVANFVGDNEITQTVNLIQGSNWFSTYVDITLEDLQNALVAALPSATNITIKGRTQSSFYNGTRWRGALGSLNLALMYQITVPESCEITLEGMAVDPAQHPVTIKNGPNWIAFPFNESMTPTVTFGNFPVSGDKIQSKSDGQATYSNRWRGALNTLVPGQGYIYQSNSAEDRTFVFPTSAK